MQSKAKKTTPVYTFSGVIACFAILMLLYFTNRFVKTKDKKDELYEQVSEPVLGVYDRNEKMTGEKAAAIKHFLLKVKKVRKNLEGRQKSFTTEYLNKL